MFLGGTWEGEIRTCNVGPVSLMVHGYCSLRFVNQHPVWDVWSKQEVNGLLLNASCNMIRLPHQDIQMEEPLALHTSRADVEHCPHLIGHAVLASVVASLHDLMLQSVPDKRDSRPCAVAMCLEPAVTL